MKSRLILHPLCFFLLVFVFSVQGQSNSQNDSTPQEEATEEPLKKQKKYKVFLKPKPDLFKSLTIKGVNTSEDLQTVDKSGKTLFHLAAYFGDIQLVKRFISQEKWALNLTTKSGNTPLDFARSSNFMRSSEVEDLLIKHKAVAYNTGYVGAFAREGKSKKDIGISTLIEIVYDKKDIKYKDREGVTFLHIASSLGDLISVKKMIEDGANVNVRTQAGNSTLDFAKDSFFLEGKLVQVFLKINGAKRNHTIIEMFRSY